MTATGGRPTNGSTGGAARTDLNLLEHAAAQTEALQVLLSLSVGPDGDRPELNGERPEPAGERDGRPVALLDVPAPRQAAAELPLTAGEAPPQREAGRARPGGRHAATRPPYLNRRGVRFVVFAAIGGSVFLLGIGIQALLTGRWQMPPLASYLIQAVVSVETSFLLNRWLTWRDRGTPFWTAFIRFNAQKTVTIVLNLVLYAGLIRLGVNYLVANVALTAVFTVVNYVAGDRLVFLPGKRAPAKPAAPAVPAQVRRRPAQQVSAVIPCRGNERTIGAAVQSLLDQDYPGLREILLIGSPGDSTWKGLAGVAHPRLTMWELKTPPGVRDANFKRDTAVRMTSGDLIALVDSDIVLGSDWLGRAVAELEDTGVGCVAGGMKSFHDSFWGRYTDSTWIGAKTPRVPRSYTVTSADFGARGRKPPILANTVFTRELYERCPIDPMWSHGSYEDYEWFWRVTKAGYPIRVCRELFGWHHHRRGLRALASEYRRSARGCAYFIREHPDSPLAKRRLRQAVVLPLAAAAGIAGAVAVTAGGYGRAVAGLLLAGTAVLAVHQVVRSRSLESLAYPLAGLTLGVVFTAGLVSNLIRPRTAAADAPFPAAVTRPDGPVARPRSRFLPVAAICAVQAALSLSLVWSNTAFTDEADYLWIGRLEIAHWLHGTPWPAAYAYQALAGSPLIYPPLGALASSAGGLAGARILSLAFMLAATILLYLTASRLTGRRSAVFAAALWAFTEPVIRLAFASYDPLSVFLMALSAWLIVQAAYRRRRGELVAAAAGVLALANLTAYPGIVIVPAVIAFAFLAWAPRMGRQQALSCTAWLAAGWAVFLVALLTALHAWAGVIPTVLGRSGPGHQGVLPVLNSIGGYAGLVICLAVIGAVTAARAHGGRRAALMILLVGAALALPAAQLWNQASSALDERLAYGIWFAAIAAGYACGKLTRWLPGASQKLAVVCCVIALAYVVVNSWESAWETYHGWANAAGFVTAFRPVAAQSQGHIYASGQDHIAEYYTPAGLDLSRWNKSLSLDPAGVAPGALEDYYKGQLSTGSYGVVVLFYSTTFSSAKAQPQIPLPKDAGRAYQNLLAVVGENSQEPGLPALTQALAAMGYQPKAEGPYSSSHASGVYVIWQRPLA